MLLKWNFHVISEVLAKFYTQAKSWSLSPWCANFSSCWFFCAPLTLKNRERRDVAWQISNSPRDWLRDLGWNGVVSAVIECERAAGFSRAKVNARARETRTGCHTPHVTPLQQQENEITLLWSPLYTNVYNRHLDIPLANGLQKLMIHVHQIFSYDLIFYFIYTCQYPANCKKNTFNFQLKFNI